jgi:hypothetical protein
MEKAERDELPNIDENGVDLTLIRAMLAMTPGDRLDMIVESSKNVAALFESARNQ